MSEAARILVVDDEPDLRELLATALRFKGYEVAVAGSGAAALESLTAHPADLVVMDVMMPLMDGFTTVRRLRARGDHVPVLFLTARDTDDDTVRGLEVGGDDYVTKPFSLAVVAARIEALLRRSRPDTETAQLRVADLVLDLDAMEAERAGQRLDLTPTEFALLRDLASHAGKVLSKAQLLEHVWGIDFDSDGGVVETYVSYLRRKVDAPFPTPLIHTRRGIGYVLREPT